MVDGKPIPVRNVADKENNELDDDSNAEAKMKALELAF